jgi:hypothetical protein
MPRVAGFRLVPNLMPRLAPVKQDQRDNEQSFWSCGTPRVDPDDAVYIVLDDQGVAFDVVTDLETAILMSELARGYTETYA